MRIFKTNKDKDTRWYYWYAYYMASIIQGFTNIFLYPFGLCSDFTSSLLGYVIFGKDYKPLKEEQ